MPPACTFSHSTILLLLLLSIQFVWEKWAKKPLESVESCKKNRHGFCMNKNWKEFSETMMMAIISPYLLGLGFVSLSCKEQFLFLLKLPDPYHCFPPVLHPKDCCLCCCNKGAAATIAAAAAPCESNMAATIASESSFFFLQHDGRRSCESLNKNFTTEKIFYCCSFA